MITDWHYDGGEPHWMEAISEWSDARPPAWRCQYRGTPHQIEAVARWLDQLAGGGDSHWRFNGGDPYLAVEIHEERDALLFLMTWG